MFTLLDLCDKMIIEILKYLNLNQLKKLLFLNKQYFNGIILNYIKKEYIINCYSNIDMAIILSTPPTQLSSSSPYNHTYISSNNKVVIPNFLQLNGFKVKLNLSLRKNPCYRTVKSFNQFDKLTYIHTLNLFGRNDITNDDLLILSRCKIHTLILNCCKNITDISMFATPSKQIEKYTIHSLHLANTDIKDYSILNNIHKLDLSWTFVDNKQISILAKGKIRKLHLWMCPNISDVSPLGNLHTLYLNGCKNIKDVSALGNIHTLSLLGCKNIKDVSMLGNVHYLDLSGCENITDEQISMLGNCHTLILSCCGQIKDISMLDKVNYLDLSYCFQIPKKKIIELKKTVKHVILRGFSFNYFEN